MAHYNKPHPRRATPFALSGRRAAVPGRPGVFTDPRRRAELAVLRTIGLVFALPLIANGLLTLLQRHHWLQARSRPGLLDAASSLHLLGQGLLALTLGLLMLAPFASSQRRAVGWVLANAGLAALAFALSLR